MILSRFRNVLYGARQITPVLRPMHRYTTHYPKSIHFMRPSTSNAEKLVEKEPKPQGLLSNMLSKKEGGPLCAYKDSSCPPFPLPPIPDKSDVKVERVVEIVPTYNLPPRQDVPFVAILGYRFILFAAKVGFVLYFIRWTMKEGLWGSGEESSEAWARLSGNFHVLTTSGDHSEPKSLAEHWNQFVYYTFDKIVQTSSNIVNKLRGQDESKLEYFRQRLLQEAEEIKDTPAEYYGTRPSSAITTMVAESKSGIYESDLEVQKLRETGEIKDSISELENYENGNTISAVPMDEIGDVMRETSEKVETAEVESSTTETKESVAATLDAKMAGILKCAESTKCSPVQKNVLLASSEFPEGASQLSDLEEKVKVCYPFPDVSNKSNVSPQSSE